jgi:hypothetical protein
VNQGRIRAKSYLRQKNSAARFGTALFFAAAFLFIKRKSLRVNGGRHSVGRNPLFGCADNLTGTQAARAGVNVAGNSVDDGFDAAYVGFPFTVGTSVGMGNLNAKSNAFSAEITFCHSSTSFT